MGVIRFPVAAKLGEYPMAVRIGWFERVKRNLFGHHRPRPKTWNSLKLDRARKGR